MRSAPLGELLSKGLEALRRRDHRVIGAPEDAVVAAPEARSPVKLAHHLLRRFQNRPEAQIHENPIVLPDQAHGLVHPRHAEVGDDDG